MTYQKKRRRRQVQVEAYFVLGGAVGGDSYSRQKSYVTDSDVAAEEEAQRGSGHNRGEEVGSVRGGMDSGGGGGEEGGVSV